MEECKEQQFAVVLFFWDYSLQRYVNRKGRARQRKRGEGMKDYAKKFYLSPAWRKTRDAYYRFHFGICERCGAAGDIVHHKIYLTPRNIHDPNVALNFANLELLCQDCHNKEHFERANKRYSFDKDGTVLPPPAKK